MPDYNEYASITLEETSLFPKNTLDFLHKLGIFNLKDLFTSFDDAEFILQFGYSVRYFSEVNGTTKLLRYKYLGEDPLLNISSENNDESYGLGFSFRASNVLKRNGITPEHLLRMIKNEDYSDLNFVRNLGVKTLREILTKCDIAASYFAEKRAGNLKDADISKLLIELKRLLRETQKLNYQVAYLKDIVEKRLNIDEEKTR